MNLNQWLSQPQPKVHFSPKQLFVPRQYLSEAESNTQADVRVIGFDNIVAKVNQHYTLPFQPYDYQARTINALADQNAVGLWAEVGAGKTLTGTVMALYHRIQHSGCILVVMPPILLRQWQRFFQSIPEINSVLVYRGTPKQRQAMDLDVDVLLVSMDIFKNDFMRLYDFFYTRAVTLIVDEAVSVKNPNTMNHKCVWAFQNQDLSKYQHSLKKKTENKSKVKPVAGTSQHKVQQAATIADVKRKINDLFR